MPWDPVGVTATTSPAHFAEPVGAPLDMPSCADSEFTVEADSQRSTVTESGWITTTLVLRSISTGFCSVPVGTTLAALVDGTGGVLPSDGSPSGAASTYSSLPVQPGQLVSIRVNWAVTEGTVPPPVSLSVSPTGDYPVSRRLSVPLVGITIPPNPERPQNIGPWRSTAIAAIDKVFDAGTLRSLSAQIIAPKAASIGSSLDYTVVLTNPTAAPIELTSCPRFTEWLDVVPRQVPITVGFTGPLNCAAAPRALQPGSSTQFAFQLDTTGQVAGDGLLHWQLVDGTTAVTDDRAEIRTRSG